MFCETGLLMRGRIWYTGAKKEGEKLEPYEAELYAVFQKIGITEYRVHEHKAIFSTREAEEEGLTMPGLNLKNLLIKDKKTEHFYMIVLEDHRQMDAKHFKTLTGWGKIRFANEEEMWDLLRLTPGAVSPFGLLNDKDHRVTVVLERLITRAPDEELVNFHPNRNTATLSLRKADFLKFLDYMGTEIIFEE